MSISTEVNAFLSLMDACFIKVNIKYNVVQFAYYNNQNLGNDMTYVELLNKCANVFDVRISPGIENEILKWLKNDGVEDYIINASTKDDTKKIISLSKTKLTGDEYLIYADNLERKKYLLSLIDPLTNLYQKVAFNNYVLDGINKNPDRKFSLCIIDIDNFKAINDNYGHLMGDEILVRVSEVLKKNISNGLVGRFGGDEFIFASYDVIDYQDVWNMLYKITHEISDIGSSFENPIDISVTVGCARYLIDADSYDKLFDDADRALYRGKRKSKNCFIIYDEAKHKNITLDGMQKTQIDERRGSYNILNTVFKIYEFLSSTRESIDILNDITAYIRTILNVDRCIIYLDDESGTETTYAKSFENAQEESEFLNIVGPASIWDMHYKGETCAIQKTYNLDKVNRPLYNKTQLEGIKSVLRAKLFYKNIKIGSIEVATYEDREWNINDKDIISVASYILSVACYKLHESKYMEHLMSVDNLTGLPTYHRFIELATKTLNSTNKPMTAYYFNIQRFKSFNDRFGFTTGDTILKNVSELLKDIFKTNLLTRVTPDRYILLDEYISNKDIDNKVKEVFARVSAIKLKNIVVGEYLTIECGVYITDGSENSMPIIIDKANLARRRIQRTYDSQYVLYDDDIQKEFNTRNDIEMYFFEGLRNDEFLLYMQPKIEISTGRLVGVEALSRWNYKKNGIIPPSFYVPHLEETKQIVDLDLYMFERLCQYIKLTIDRNMQGHVPVSVNLSRNQRDFNDYINKLEIIRKKYNIDSNLIEIEITENTFTEDTERISHLIDNIHKLGYRVAMDDFGSGYSNLSALVNCGFDIIKIDKSLCAESLEDKKSYILEAIINLSKKLGISIICEGVETKEQADNLLKLGCNCAQGYLYDKPIPVLDFISKYLEDNNA